MTEYADRKIQEGMEDREAYIRAAKLMFWPIVSSTATTLVAFLPMLLWPGVAGEFMSYLPIMVIIVLTASLFTAMVFLPVTGGILAQVSHFLNRYAAGLLALTFGVLAAVIVGFGPFVPMALEGVVPAVAATGVAILCGWWPRPCRLCFLQAAASVCALVSGTSCQESRKGTCGSCRPFRLRSFRCQESKRVHRHLCSHPEDVCRQPDRQHRRHRAVDRQLLCDRRRVHGEPDRCSVLHR